MTEKDTLRRRAEAQLGTLPEKPERLEPEDFQRTLHELQVHQIELEMQNEELCRTQVALEESRARYFDLFDLAPVGYLTLSETGKILEANLYACTLLKCERRRLVQSLLTQFIMDEDQDIYYKHCKQLIAAGTPQEYTLRMIRHGGAPFWAHLVETTVRSADGQASCSMVLSDIHASKMAEQCISEQLEELRRWQQVMLVREDRVEELKREVNKLCHERNLPARYPSQEEAAT